MKFTTAILAVLTGLVSGRPNNDFVDAVNATEGPLANCIIYGYTSGDCSGGAKYAYDFVVGGCRSCEPFNDCHSFRLADGCPSGHFEANEGACNNRGDVFNIGFGGPGCHNVNTGKNWVSGRPCFN